MKQETLEEAAKERYSLDKEINERIAFKRGYTECSEAMYSEEEVINIQKEWNEFDEEQDTFNGQDDLTFEEWFEQFKKK
jgi:hypothetical protein